MHHPKRAAMLPTLIYALGGGIPVTVIADVESRGPWPTARQAWLAWRRGATHHLVLQDDAMPVPDLIRGLAGAIATRPHSVIGLWTPRKEQRTAFERGDRWMLSEGGTWGPGTIMPTERIGEWLEWDGEHVDPECPHDDTRIALWLLTLGEPAWLTVPSLVEHVSLRSLLGHRGANPAAAFTGRPATSIDWTPVPDHPVRIAQSLRSYWGAKYLIGGTP